MPGGGAASSLIKLCIIAGLGVYGVANSLYNVEGGHRTIVFNCVVGVKDKEWITECYKQQKLVEIETYLMHAGKPWKRQSVSHESSQEKPSTSRKTHTRAEKSSPFKTTAAPSSEPEPHEIKKIATEGILTCLQDAIDSLKQGQVYP